MDERRRLRPEPVPGTHIRPCSLEPVEGVDGSNELIIDSGYSSVNELFSISKAHDTYQGIRVLKKNVIQRDVANKAPN